MQSFVGQFFVLLSLGALVYVFVFIVKVKSVGLGDYTHLYTELVWGVKPPIVTP